mgnify:CR=1 FL=1
MMPKGPILKTVAQGPINSAYDTTGPGIWESFFGQKHEALVFHVLEQPTPGLPTFVSVTKQNGEAFAHLSDNNVVQIFTPFYRLDKVEPVSQVTTFTFGNDRVKSHVTVSFKGSGMMIDLRCQRNDPDIPASVNYDKRPYLLIVTYKDPATGVVYRGEQPLVLNGWVN